MKRYSMFSALWLIACGASAGPSDVDDATLSAPLADGEDDGADPTELASDDDGADDAPADVWNGPDADATPVGEYADPSIPTMVIGGGGQAWTEPTSGGILVWCASDVPIGCPAVAPAPDAGHLVVVQSSSDIVTMFVGSEAGGSAGSAVSGGYAASAPVGSGSAEPSAGASATPDTAPVGAGVAAPTAGGVAIGTEPAGAGAAADPAPASGGASVDTAPIPGDIIYVDAVPAPGAAPGPQLPVAIGGSFPPGAGTCVVVTFGAGGSAGVSGAVDDGQVGGAAGGEPSAGSSAEVSDVASEQHARPAPPGSPQAGGASAPVPGSPNGPSSGAVPFPPVLPPPGSCLGVSYPHLPGDPSVPATLPDAPDAPVPGHPATPVPVDHPGPGTMAPVPCVGVAFAATDSPSSEAVVVTSTMCALPVPPQSGAGAPPAPVYPEEPEAQIDDPR